MDEKSASVNGITIHRPSPVRESSVEVMSTIDDIDSEPCSPVVTRHKEKFMDDDDPLAFYKPSPGIDSQKCSKPAKNESKQHINVYDTDVEACLTPQKTTASGGSSKLLKNKTKGFEDCSMWPGQRAMQMKKKAMKRDSAMCGCWGGLSNKTRMVIKILIAVFVTGAAVGIGVGVSKAVGGGVWKNSQAVNAPIASRSLTG